jgi:hypothetical protein
MVLFIASFSDYFIFLMLSDVAATPVLTAPTTLVAFVLAESYTTEALAPASFAFSVATAAPTLAAAVATAAPSFTFVAASDVAAAAASVALDAASLALFTASVVFAHEANTPIDKDKATILKKCVIGIKMELL